ncbi:G2/mitotic-specific cyclin C13-1 [Euphorbia peplus]|nr:G2/mitotic-specific cyclin C13-1 [Euphorbia peplus]
MCVGLWQTFERRIEFEVKFQILQIAFFMNIRCLRIYQVDPKKWHKPQLLGVSSMLVVKMEADMLKAFKFELETPTIKTFLRSGTWLFQDLACSYSHLSTTMKTKLASY